MTTDAILTALQDLPEAPWAEIVAGKPLNARGLSKRLAGYDIKPKSIRAGEKVVRGYAREDLADAWERYLLPAAVADDAQEAAKADGVLSSSPRESATSATSATASSEAPPNGRAYPHDSVGFGQDRFALGQDPATPMQSATFVTPDVDVADVAHVADVRGDREAGLSVSPRKHDVPNPDRRFSGHATGAGLDDSEVVELAKRLADLSPDDLQTYRHEVAAAPPDDLDANLDRQALALFDVAYQSGAIA